MKETGRRPGRLDKSSGFTLFEMMVSLAILTVGMAGATTAISMGMEIIYAARNKQMALHEARRQVERVRTLDFASAELTDGKYALYQSAYGGRIRVRDRTATRKDVNVRVNYDLRKKKKGGKVVLVTSITEPLH